MHEPLHHLHPLVWSHDDERERHALFLRDLLVPAHIGVYDHEHGRTQNLRFNLTVDLALPIERIDRLDSVLDYDRLRQGILDLVGAGHINLLETLADRIVELCFGFTQVRGLHLRIEKLEAHGDCIVGYETRRKR
ncbi:MAG: dihydroneopterin aldolase [Burkholderiales bacterium]|nr:dihydroneopterin aldolase [Burkholderiales bacterium]